MSSGSRDSRSSGRPPRPAPRLTAREYLALFTRRPREAARQPDNDEIEEQPAPVPPTQNDIVGTSQPPLLYGPEDAGPLRWGPPLYEPNQPGPSRWAITQSPDPSMYMTDDPAMYLPDPAWSGLPIGATPLRMIGEPQAPWFEGEPVGNDPIENLQEEPQEDIEPEPEPEPVRRRGKSSIPECTLRRCSRRRHRRRNTPPQDRNSDNQDGSHEVTSRPNFQAYENMVNDPSAEERNQDTRSSNSWTGSNSPDYYYEGTVNTEESATTPPQPPPFSTGYNYWSPWPSGDGGWPSK